MVFSQLHLARVEWHCHTNNDCFSIKKKKEKKKKNDTDYVLFQT